MYILQQHLESFLVFTFVMTLSSKISLFRSDCQVQAMERKHPGVRFVHLDIFFDMTVQVYRYGLHDADDDDDFSFQTFHILHLKSSCF